ncbi:MAG: Smr/MutS family protein [Proteobacteria bacterium]|nr:Smr/MutS family protein [Pseudomonadota bacterium]
MFSKLKKLIKSGKNKFGKSEKRVHDRHDSHQDTSISPPVTVTPIAKPHKKSAPVRFNKKGIRVFENDQDVSQLFGIDDTGANELAERVEDIICVKGPQKKVHVPKPRFNRHGFPILDQEEDLGALMAVRGLKDNMSERESDDRPQKKVSKKDAPKDKHGIPILEPGASLFGSKDSSGQSESFNDLLLESLGDKSFDVLLHEKKDLIKKRKKLSLKQMLKAFPLPQGRLDLHGYTALKAELRAESYLKNAFYNQTHTVIIIVGKGLHSDEGAVLPDVVEGKVIHLKKEGLVLAYEWDNKKKSRSGAVTVFLNNMAFG